MSGVLCWTPKEQTAIAQFKERLADLDLNNELFEERRLIKWLRARDFRLDDAEIMFRKHLKWRKDNNIQNILRGDSTIFHVAGTLAADLFGFDNGKNLVVGLYGSTIDFKKLLHFFGKSGTIEIFIVLFETALVRLVETSTESSQLKQVLYIQDLDGDRVSDYLSPDVVDVLIEIAKCIDANYPEMLYKAYIINAPPICSLLYSMVRPFMSPRTTDKITILGNNEDKINNCVFGNISKSQIPPRWGGSFYAKRSPLFNISMKTGVKEENVQKLKQISILPGEQFDLVYHFEKKNTVISWSFQTEAYDIGFVILHKPSEYPIPISDPTDSINSLDIILYRRLNSHKNSQTGSIMCCKPGEYRLQFDNTYSRYRTKVLFYQITIMKDD